MGARIEWDKDLGEGDLAYDNGVIAQGGELTTACVLSLHSDAPALDGDRVPPGAARRGWCLDGYALDGDVWGSRLWLLVPGRARKAAPQRARQMAEDALEGWMGSDGVAESVAVAVDASIEGRIGLSVEVQRPGRVPPDLIEAWSVPA